MNMISTGAFLNEMDASNKQSTLAEKFAAVWEKKNAKAARAGGVSLMALSLAACGSSSTTTTTTSTDTDTSTTTDTTTTTTTAAAKTILMTTSTDNVVGGAGDDIIIGDNTNTDNDVSLADQVDGGAGTDTLKVYDDTVIPEISNVEHLWYNSPDGDINFSAKDGVVEVTIENQVTEDDNEYKVAAGTKVNLKDITQGSAGEDLEIDMAATVTSLDVTMDTVGASGAPADFDILGTGVKTLSIETKDDSVVDLDNAGAAITKLVLTGAGDMTLSIDDAGLSALKTFDASAATGDVSITTDANRDTDLTLTGGSGADTFDLGAEYEKTDTIDGGAGEDTLSIDDADANPTAVQTNVKNIEVLAINSALDSATVDGAKFGVNKISLTSTSAGVAGTIEGITSGATLTLAAADYGDTSAVDVNLSDAAGSGDSLTLDINTASGTSDIDIDVTGVEDLTIDTVGAKVATNVDLTGAQVDTITLLLGDKDFDLDLAAGGTVISSVDGSGSAGDGAMNIALSTSAVQGATIKGTANGDTIAASSADDEIIAGAGDDTIDALAGTNTVDISAAGDDTVQISGIALTGNKTTITGFDSGDTLDILNDSVDGAHANVTSPLASQATADGENTYILTFNASTTAALSGGAQTVADFTDLTDVAAYIAEAYAASNDSGDDDAFVLNDGTNSYVYVFTDGGDNTTIDADEIGLVAVVNNYVLTADEVATT